MSTPSTPHDDHTRPVSDERRYLARQALARRYGLDPADIQGTSPDQMDRHARILARTAAMRRHPAGKQLTAADGTPEKPLPTERPTDHA